MQDILFLKKEGRSVLPRDFGFSHLQQKQTELTLTYAKLGERSPTADVKFSLSAGQTSV